MEVFYELFETIIMVKKTQQLFIATPLTNYLLFN